MDTQFSGINSTKRVKRADQIVESVKRWVVVEGIQAGDKLPNEKALMELFECSKGTVREALKSLEVQGLITVKTGPNGGAILAEVPYELASDMLRNFFHFQHPTGPDIYQLRKLVEPEIAVLASVHLNATDLDELSRLTELCAEPAQDIEQRLQQRIAELDFHNHLADRCGNPLLRFVGRFLNDLIKDLVIFKKVQLPEQREFSKANLEYHRKLLCAFKTQDTVKVHQLMAEHMRSAEAFNIELEAQLSQGFLTRQD
ncbi:GntR family transcriptional regulator [Nitrincola tibetensis]|uniref:GntR family transcriptional regulator n=1 Tax=Nitrincola tibetensis TaxID=2219697 RepID=A0A364NIR9_9GAMM|nr:FCD domain-containing protein [Nitrincola tibetensis]RAU16953.1 GntR family transcriptional regulator [Nitrincola tibetensis]